MVITYHGDSYFKIQSGSLTLLIDPTNHRSMKGANLIISTTDPPAVEHREGNEGKGAAAPFWITHPGEYGVSGVAIRGWSTGNDGKHEHTAYRLTIDGITVAVLGHLTRELPGDIQVALRSPDILMLPTGAKPWLAAGAAAKLTRQLEPSAVVPSLFQDLRPFLKELGRTDVRPEEKLVVKKKDLPPKALAVRWLSPR